MSTAEQRASELEDNAIKDALAKISVFEDAVSRLWSEANAIPGGCGGTPFRSDASAAEDKLCSIISEFLKRYGERGRIELGKLRLFYGVRRTKP